MLPKVSGKEIPEASMTIAVQSLDSEAQVSNSLHALRRLIEDDHTSAQQLRELLRPILRPEESPCDKMSVSDEEPKKAPLAEDLCNLCWAVRQTCAILNDIGKRLEI